MASLIKGVPPRVAAALAGAAVGSHRYREAILGDLVEEYGEIEAASGRGPARRWYWGQAARLPLGAGPSLRLAVLALAVYVAILGADALSTRLLMPGLELPVIATSGILGGFILRRSAKGAAFIALALLWGIALAVGAPYVVRGWGGGETTFHVAKVCAVLVAVTAGTLLQSEGRQQLR